MEFTRCLLDVENGSPIGNMTIAARIREQGKEHLWDERRDGDIDTVVIHHISAVEVQPDVPHDRAAILGIMCEFGVSSHYLVERDGHVLQLVPEECRAWHAGGSIMPAPDDRRGVNEFSVGIELVATPHDAYTDEQYVSLVDLCGELQSRHGPLTFLGHEDVAGDRAVAMGLRTERKADPGPRFDWERFRRLLA